MIRRKIDRPAGAVQGNNHGLKNVASEIGKKRGVTLKFLKGLDMALGIAFAAFQAWDMAEHWKEVSKIQRAFAVLQCALIFIVTICEILAFVFPATACIPVIGAIAAVLCLVVGFFITFLIGDREPQKPKPTDGETWMANKKRNLESWDDPPSPLLDYKIDVVKDSNKIGQVVQLKLTATNKAGADTELIPMEKFTNNH